MRCRSRSARRPIPGVFISINEDEWIVQCDPGEEGYDDCEDEDDQ